MHIDDRMLRRTTLLLDEEIYGRLVEESVKRYRTAKAVSKVVNEVLGRALGGEKDVIELIHSRRVATTTAKRFEEFRRQLSSRLER